MKRRIGSLLLAFIMMIMLLPVQAMAAGTVNYDPAKAIQYADGHWDDGYGLCAAYVARCLKAGGINVMETGFGVVATLYKRLKNKDYTTQYKLTYNGNYKNSAKVQPGDPIFYYCETCKKALHVVICRRIDSNGRIRYNAHNSAAYDKKLYSATASHCAHYSNHKYSIYGLHINRVVRSTGVNIMPSGDQVLSRGESVALNAAVVPSNATEKGILWMSSNADIVSVDQNGVITGINFGSAVITAKPKDGYGSAAEVRVTVKKPYAVSNVTAANHAKGVRIVWSLNESASADADGFIVYRKLPGKNWTRIANLENSQVRSYIDSSAMSGTTYTYTVRAYIGEQQTMGSYPKSGSTVLYLAQPKISDVSNAQKGITVKWAQVSGAKNYRVYRKMDGGSWKRIKTVSANTLSYTDTAAESGVKYTYTIRAMNGETLSAYDGQSGKIIRLTTPVLSSVQTRTGVKVSWKTVVGSKSYRVYRKLVGGSWKRLKTVGKSTLSYVDTTPEAGKNYIYTVRAVHDNILSSYDARSGVITYLP